MVHANQRPVALETGDWVRAMVHLMPVEEMVTWRVEVTGRDGVAKAKSTHSTFKGTLIAKEDLHRMRPDYVPGFRRRVKSSVQFWSCATAHVPHGGSRKRFASALQKILICR